MEVKGDGFEGFTVNVVSVSGRAAHATLDKA
jgi:hypothetical protein